MDSVVPWSGAWTPYVGEFLATTGDSRLEIAIFFLCELPAISGFGPKTGSCQGHPCRDFYYHIST